VIIEVIGLNVRADLAWDRLGIMRLGYEDISVLFLFPFLLFLLLFFFPSLSVVILFIFSSFLLLPPPSSPFLLLPSSPFLLLFL